MVVGFTLTKCVYAAVGISGLCVPRKACGGVELKLEMVTNNKPFSVKTVVDLDVGNTGRRVW